MSGNGGIQSSDGRVAPRLNRHCEKGSDEAIQESSSAPRFPDCFASFAMTAATGGATYFPVVAASG
jgi:hypothetical protein